jgi:hypothetical protein
VLLVSLSACSVPQTAAVVQAHEVDENDPVLVCLRSHESANLSNPWAAYNPAGPYYGAYQWLQGSWNSAATATGHSNLAGLQPIEPTVSRWDQDAVTLEYHHMVGDGPWGNRC